MVKDHSDSERIHAAATWATDRIAHTTAFATSVKEHWLEQEISQWVHHEESIRQPIEP